LLEECNTVPEDPDERQVNLVSEVINIVKGVAALYDPAYSHMTSQKMLPDVVMSAPHSRIARQIRECIVNSDVWDPILSSVVKFSAENRKHQKELSNITKFTANDVTAKTAVEFMGKYRRRQSSEVQRMRASVVD
jgi:hypothetical protein